MGRIKLLLGLVIGALLVVAGGTASVAVTCPDDVCGLISDDGAVLEGHQSGGDTSGSQGNLPGGGTSPAPSSTTPASPPGTVFGVPCERLAAGDEVCEEQLANVRVDISDIAHFRPAPPAQRMEPNGWAVVGVPANFIAQAGTQTLSGQILGIPADVRFTPIAYVWEYGDGRHDRRSTPGASWSSLGLAEFSSTPTSHIYGAPGRFTVTLSVDYAVDFRLRGTAWRTIDGVLTLRAPETAVTVARANTVLVEDDCRSNPHGPGC